MTATARPDTGRVQGSKDRVTVAKWNHDPEALPLVQQLEAMGYTCLPNRPPDEVIVRESWSTLDGEEITDPEMIQRLEAQLEADQHGDTSGTD